MKKPLIWEKVGHPKLTYCPRCRTPLKEEVGLGSPGMGYPYRSSYEMVAFGQKGNRGVPQDRNVRDVLRFPKVKHKDAYPTEKPIDLLQVMIKQSTLPGDIVLDPFAGSGSTLMAAQRSGRKSLGFDISRDAIDHYHKSNAIFQLSVPWII